MTADSRLATLTFVTGNGSKLAMVRSILEGVVDVQHAHIPGLVEIQGSLEDIARDKCRRAAEEVGGPVLIDDTALEFKALNGLPGPYIKDFLQAVGHAGLNRLLAAYSDKTAYAVCTIACSDGPGHEPILFQGRVEGRLVDARGPLDLGWDAVFEYQGQTYAEMKEKGRGHTSPRRTALNNFKTWFIGGK